MLGASGGLSSLSERSPADDRVDGSLLFFGAHNLEVVARVALPGEGGEVAAALMEVVDGLLGPFVGGWVNGEKGRSGAAWAAFFVGGKAGDSLCVELAWAVVREGEIDDAALLAALFPSVIGAEGVAASNPDAMLAAVGAKPLDLSEYLWGSLPRPYARDDHGSVFSRLWELLKDCRTSL